MNKDTPQAASWRGCVRLPNVSHGLNDYSAYHHALLLSAINPRPHHYAFLAKMWEVDADEVKTALHRQTIYQAVSRTSIRNPANQDRKTWVLPDRQTAEWLADVFEGATLHALPVFAPEQVFASRKRGPERKYASAAEKSAAYRVRKERRERIRLTRKARLDVVNGRTPSGRAAEEAYLVAHEGMIEPGNICAVKTDPQQWQGTFLPFFKDTDVDLFLLGSFDGLAELFGEWATMTYDEKEDVPAWTPCRYSRYREQTNFAFARHIAIDVDKGTLTAHQFAEMFGSWNMLVYSSWSNSPQQVKWRAIIETDVAMDAEGYRLITGFIEDRLRDHGITGCLDRSKMSAFSVFHMPSQGLHPEHAFFDDLRGGRRRPLDVYAVLGTIPVTGSTTEPPAAKAIVPPVLPPLPTVTAEGKPISIDMQRLGLALRDDRAAAFRRAKDARVQDALDAWRVGNKAGERNRNFWMLASRLQNAGCSHVEIADHLHDVAGSNGKLRSQAKRILGYL